MSVHLYTGSHFSLTVYRAYISHLARLIWLLAFERDWICFPGWTPAVWNFCCSLATVRTASHAEWSRSLQGLEEMIGDRPYALTLEFFQDKFTELGFIQTTEAPNQHFSN